MPQYDLPEDELRTYRTRAIAPEDLTTFWTTTLAEARASWWAPKVEQVDTAMTLVDVHDVTFSGFGGDPVRAWYRRPANVEGDLPIVVRYQGYTGGRGLPHQVGFLPLAGYATLEIDNRGVLVTG